MPHPAEDQMFLRIQTAEGVSAQDALRKGLKDLKEKSFFFQRRDFNFKDKIYISSTIYYI